MNSYANLGDLTIKMEGDRLMDERLRLRQDLETASREIDSICGRFFYCEEGTRYQDGANKVLRFDTDVLSITTLKLDFDADGTYEESLATTDYILYPRNRLPKTYAELAHLGNYGTFNRDIRDGVEITGVFGYGNGLSASPYSSLTTLSAAVSSTTATTISATDYSAIQIGMTLRIDSEQLYVSDVQGNTITVERGVNGTTAATHSNSTAIYVYNYPALVKSAAIIMAQRLYEGNKTGWQDVKGGAEVATSGIFKAAHPVVKGMLGKGRLIRTLRDFA